MGTIDTCMAPLLHQLVEIVHTAGAVVAVQRLWRDLTMTEMTKKDEPTGLSCEMCLAK